jgi:5-oxoprolinase (ATP-hydrolysing) subunit A
MNASENGTATQARCIDLNADLGEGFPNDRSLLELVTSASICCAAHAGSRETIRQTLEIASARAVVVGAHPGYADRDGFGRRDQSLTRKQLIDLIRSQLDLLLELAGETDARVAFLKPHGALYNQAQRQLDVATPVVFAAEIFQLPLLGQPESVLEATAREHGVPFIAEGFPDRRYRADGSLVPRSEPDAVLIDPREIEAQVVRLVHDGRVATLCIHGDDPRAVANAMNVRKILETHGISIRPFMNGSGRWD